MSRETGRRLTVALVVRHGRKAGSRAIALLSSSALVLSMVMPAGAAITVSNFSELNAAIATVNSGGDNAINFANSIVLSGELTAVTRGVTITGNGYTLNGANTYRGLFIAAGSGQAVSITDLTIANGYARGGTGGGQGGGGMGAGGGIFAMSGDITLTNVSLSGNTAQGGSGGGNAPAGGGGGLGGNGGGGGAYSGGGGGVGIGATGGNSSTAGGAGILVGSSGGGSGSGGTAGGTSGGGGGGSGSNGSAGGGVGGGNGGTNGGHGGFGGGGGGGGGGPAGNGGFGGGGGGGYLGTITGGYGGFGGGGGGGQNPGGGGFGGGNGSGVSVGGGGGGMGAGGSIFVCTATIDPTHCSATLTINNTASVAMDGNVVAGAGGLNGGSGAALGGAVFLTNGEQLGLSIAPGTTTTISSSIFGYGDNGLAVSGGGTLALGSSSNSFNGLSVTGSGTRVGIGADGALGNGSLSFADGTGLRFTATGTYSKTLAATSSLTLDTQGNVITYSGLITDGSSAGTLDAIGGGTLILTNASNSYTGGTHVYGATTLQLSAAGQIGSGTLTLGTTGDSSTSFLSTTQTFSLNNAVAVAGDGNQAIEVAASRTLTLPQILSGTQNLDLIGAGTLVFGNTGNTYSGNITLYNSAVLEGTTATLTASRISGAGTLVFNQTTTGNFAGDISTDAVTITGTGGNVTLGGSNSITGTMTVRGDATLTSATDLGSANMVLGDASTRGTLAVTGSYGLSSGTLTLNNGGGTINVANTRVLGLSKQIEGGGALTVNGAGRIVLSGANTYSGGTILSAGTLDIAGDTVRSGSTIVSSAIGTGTLTLDGGTLTANANRTLYNAIQVNSTGGTIDSGANLLELNGDISNGSGTGTLTIAGSSGGAVLLGGADSHSGATIVSASATLQPSYYGALSANSDYTVNGTLNLRELGGGSSTIKSLSGSGTVTNTLAGNSILHIATGSGQTATYNGTISDYGGGNPHIGIAINGAGTQIFTQANTYGGGTTLTSGRLVINDAGALGSGAITFDGGTLQIGDSYTFANALAVTAGGGTLNTGGFATTLSGNITGTNPGPLTFAGGGSASLTGDNSAFGGGYSVSSGTLELNGRNTAGTGNIVMGNGTVLKLNADADGSNYSSFSNNIRLSGAAIVRIGAEHVDLSGVISEQGGPASLTIEGVSYATTGASLQGVSTYSGGTMLTNVGVALWNNNALGTGAITLEDASLYGPYVGLRLANDIILNEGAPNQNSVLWGGFWDGVISTGTGAPTLVLVSATLNGANTYSGRTELQGWTTTAGNSAAFGTSEVYLDATLQAASGTTLDIANNIFLRSSIFYTPTLLGNGTTLTLSGTIADDSAPGSLMIGSGGAADTSTVILSGNNTFTQGLIIAGGTVRAATSTALGDASSAVVMQAGTVLDYADGITIVNALEFHGDATLSVGSGASATQSGDLYSDDPANIHTVTKAGSGTLTLTGDNFSNATLKLIEGTLVVANGSAVGGSKLVFDGGTFQVNSNVSLANDLEVLSGGGTFDTNGFGSELTGTLTSDVTGGPLTITGTGSLKISGLNNLAAGAVLDANAVLEVAGASGLSAADVSIAANSELRFSTVSSTFTNRFNLDSTAIFNVASGIITNLSGVIADASTPSVVQKEGAGTLVLSGANTYSGGTLVNDGMLLVNHASALGTGDVKLDGGALGWQSGVPSLSDVDNDIVLLGGGGTIVGPDSSMTANVNGTISGSGLLSLGAGGGGYVSLNGTNTYDGGTYVDVGKVIAGNSAAFGTGDVTLVGSILSVYDTVDLANNIALDNFNTIQIWGTADLTLSGVISEPSVSPGMFLQVSGDVAALSRSGILRVTGANTYEMVTVLSSVTVEVGNNAALGTGDVSLERYSNLQLTPGLNMGNVLFSDATSVVDVASGTATWSGTILNNGSSILASLNKTGSGTLVLTGANNYSGGTFVQQGTLKLDAAQAANSLGAYDISSGATLQVGSGLGNVYIGSLSGAGDLLSSSDLNVGLGVNADTSFAGVITAASLIYHGEGVMTLSGTGSQIDYLQVCDCASLTLSGGSMTVGDFSVGGTLRVADAAQLTAPGFEQYAGNVTVDGAGTLLDATDSGTGMIVIVTNGSPASTFTISDGAQVMGDNLLAIAAGGTDGPLVTVRGTGSLLSLTNVAQISEGTALTATDGAVLTAPFIDMYSGSTLTIGTGANAGTVGDASSRIQGLDPDTRVVANFDGDYTLEGLLTGSLGVTVQKGYLTLNNALNDYSGGTIIGADGVLILENSAAGTGAITNAGFLVIQNSAASTFDYNMTGPGGLVQTGDGALTINTAQTYMGRTVIAPNATMLVTAAGDLSQSSAIELYGALDVSGVTASNIAINSLYGDGDLSIGNRHLTIAGNGGAYSGMLNDGGAGGSLTLLGNQILNGIVSLRGTTTIGAGATLTVSGPNALGGGALNFLAGSILKFGPGASGTYTNPMTFALGAPVFDVAGQNVTFSGVLGGPGDLAVTGANGTLTLTNNANTYGDGTAIYGGSTLRASADGQLGGVAPLLLGNATTQGTFRYAGAFTLGSGRAITVNAGGGVIHTNGFDVAIGSAISGTGTLTKAGSGKLNLTGTSSFAGATNVTGGTLAVNGSLGSSSVTVSNGANLGGTGTVGSTTIAMGGNLAPGNSIGTLNVNGNLTFNAGSLYTAEVSPTAADRVNVTGNATLAGTLALVPEAGAYAPATYRLINAASVTGTFNTVTGTVAGYTNAVQYSATGVDFVLSSPGGAVVVPPGPGGGSPAPVITTFLFDTYGRTANQIAAGTALAASASNAPLYVAMGNVVTSNNNIPAALDAVSGEIHATVLASQLETLSLTRRILTNRMRQDAGATGWAVWGDTAGSWGSIDGDGNAAGANRSGAAITLGADTSLGANWRAGVSGGYGQNTVNVAARSSSAKVQSGHIGAYAYGQYDAIRLRSGFAYGFGTADTLRGVNFTNFSNGATAEQDSNSLQLFGEAGYRVTTGGLALEPFVGLAWSRMELGAFSETGGFAALGGEVRKAEAGTFTVGLQADTRSFAFAGGKLTPGLRGGWQHALNNSLAMRNLSYLSTGQSFAMRGTPVDGDRAVLDVDLALALGQYSSVTLGYFGSYADRTSEKGVRLMVSLGL